MVSTDTALSSLVHRLICTDSRRSDLGNDSSYFFILLNINRVYTLYSVKLFYLSEERFAAALGSARSSAMSHGWVKRTKRTELVGGAFTKVHGFRTQNIDRPALMKIGLK